MTILRQFGFLNERKRFTFIVLALAVCVLTSGTLGASPAQAASCYRQSCNFKNPIATGCANSSTGTIDSFAWNGVYVELRLSGTCRAAWTKSTYPRCDNAAAGTIYTEAFYDWEGKQWAGTTSAPISCNGLSTYTNMLSFYFYVRSCIHTYSGARYCTRLH
jgi:hypothetical protein